MSRGSIKSSFKVPVIIPSRAAPTITSEFKLKEQLNKLLLPDISAMLLPLPVEQQMEIIDFYKTLYDAFRVDDIDTLNEYSQIMGVDFREMLSQGQVPEVVMTNIADATLGLEAAASSCAPDFCRLKFPLIPAYKRLVKLRNENYERVKFQPDRTYIEGFKCPRCGQERIYAEIPRITRSDEAAVGTYICDNCPWRSKQ